LDGNADKNTTGTASTAGCRQPRRPAGASTAATRLLARQGTACGVPKSPAPCHRVGFGLTGCCAPKPAAPEHVPKPGHGRDEPSRRRHGIWHQAWARIWGCRGEQGQQRPGAVWESTSGRAGGTQRRRCSRLAPSAAGHPTTPISRRGGAKRGDAAPDPDADHQTPAALQARTRKAVGEQDRGPSEPAWGLGLEAPPPNTAQLPSTQPLPVCTAPRGATSSTSDLECP